MSSLLILSDEDVRGLISPAEAVQCVERGFRYDFAGEVIAPIGDTRIEAAERGAFMAYLAWVPARGWLGAKILSAFDGNPAAGFPFVHALTAFHDVETGRPLCVMNGSYLTALRTGAAAAVATKYLARKDATVLGILGAGLQAGTSLATHLAACHIERVLIWARNQDQAEVLAHTTARSHPTLMVDVVANSEAVLDAAGVVCSTTRATKPLFNPAALRPGTHLNVIGPLRPNATEVDAALLRHVHFVTDSRPKFLKLWHGHDIPQPYELGAIMTGMAPGRSFTDQMTLFKPVGMAFEDVVTAALVYTRARERGLGTYVDW